MIVAGIIMALFIAWQLYCALDVDEPTGVYLFKTTLVLLTIICVFQYLL
jgi:hypothetical protein